MYCELNHFTNEQLDDTLHVLKEVILGHSLAGNVEEVEVLLDAQELIKKEAWSREDWIFSGGI